MNKPRYRVYRDKYGVDWIYDFTDNVYRRLHEFGWRLRYFDGEWKYLRNNLYRFQAP